MTDSTPPRKRRGRPPLDPDDPSINVHFRLPAKQYDAAFAEAQRERVSLAEHFRRKVLSPKLDKV